MFLSKVSTPNILSMLEAPSLQIQPNIILKKLILFDVLTNY